MLLPYIWRLGMVMLIWFASYWIMELMWICLRVGACVAFTCHPDVDMLTPWSSYWTKVLSILGTIHILRQQKGRWVGGRLGGWCLLGWVLKVRYFRNNIGIIFVAKKCAVFSPKLCILNSLPRTLQCSWNQLTLNTTQFQNLFFRIVFGTFFGQWEKCIIFSEKSDL